MTKQNFWTHRAFALLFAACLTASSIFAAGATPQTSINPSDDSVIKPTEADSRFISDYQYRKANVYYTYEWSNPYRVSNNLRTGPAGGSISSNTTVSVGTTVSGVIDSLNLSLNASVSSAKNYTLNVGPNKNVYMGFKVRYEVEHGTREKYDIITNKTVQSNSYTVKRPQYGEYTLVNIGYQLIE